MPLDREQLESLLSAYLDDELTDQERAEVEAFLAADADARRLLDDLRATIAGLNALPRAKASDEFADALRSHLERRALLGAEAPLRMPRVSSPASAGRRFAAAAIIVLATFAGYFTWSFTRDPGHREQYAFKEETRPRTEQAMPGEAQPAPQPMAAAARQKTADESQARDAIHRGLSAHAPADKTAEYAIATERMDKENAAGTKSAPAGGEAGSDLAARGVALKQDRQLAAAPPQPSQSPPVAVGPAHDLIATAESQSTLAGQASDNLDASSPTNPTAALAKAPASAPSALAMASADTKLGSLDSLDAHTPAERPQGTMPVLGPDLSSRPATPVILAQATDAPARREAFIVAGSPVLAKAAASAPSATPTATQPASATMPTVATRPTPASTPTTTRAITSQASSGPAPQ